MARLGAMSENAPFPRHPRQGAARRPQTPLDGPGTPQDAHTPRKPHQTALRPRTAHTAPLRPRCTTGPAAEMIQHSDSFSFPK